MRRSVPLAFAVSCALWASVGPGVVSVASAQQSLDAPTWSSRDLTRACWFGGKADQCARQVALVWDRFKQSTRAAVRPPTGQMQLVRDGTFLEPYALNFFMLKGHASTTGPDLCKRLPVELQDPQQLSRLACAASLELRPSKRDSWKPENDQFQDLRKKLAAAGCMVLTPDPCVGPAGERFALPLEFADEPTALATAEDLSELIVDVE